METKKVDDNISSTQEAIREMTEHYEYVDPTYVSHYLLNVVSTIALVSALHVMVFHPDDLLFVGKLVFLITFSLISNHLCKKAIREGKKKGTTLFLFKYIELFRKIIMSYTLSISGTTIFLSTSIEENADIISTLNAGELAAINSIADSLTIFSKALLPKSLLALYILFAIGIAIWTTPTLISVIKDNISPIY